MAFDPREYLKPNPINRDTSAFDSLAQSGMLQTMADRAAGKRSAASDASGLAGIMAGIQKDIEIERMTRDRELQGKAADAGLWPEAFPTNQGYNQPAFNNLQDQIQSINALNAVAPAALSGMLPRIPTGTPTQLLTGVFQSGLPPAEVAAARTTASQGLVKTVGGWAMQNADGTLTPIPGPVPTERKESQDLTLKSSQTMSQEQSLREQGYATVEVNGRTGVGKLVRDPSNPDQMFVDSSTVRWDDGKS